VRKESNNMDLSPQEAAFVKSEMERVEGDDTRQPTERVEAERIKEKANVLLTE
jgi:hypothetical protein